MGDKTGFVRPGHICPILALCIDSFRIVIKKNVHVLKHAEKLKSGKSIHRKLGIFILGEKTTYYNTIPIAPNL